MRVIECDQTNPDRGFLEIVERIVLHEAEAAEAKEIRLVAIDRRSKPGMRASA
jgi:hypothetical protein